MARSNKEKRRVPVLKLPMSVDIDYDKIVEMPEIKEAILDEILSAVKYGINNKKNSIVLFTVAHSDYEIDLEKAQWSNSLQSALDYFIKKEEYSKCIDCRDLLNKLSYDEQGPN